jgi:hypothetical protein
MAKKIKIMAVHGLGDHRNVTWEEDWQLAIESCFPASEEIQLEFCFINYDYIFEEVKISGWETAQALWKLTRSGIGSLFRRRRGVIGDVSNKVKWTAGYVVAWLEDEAFKTQSRKLMLDKLAEEKPDIVLAHSLGSLITYNAFTHRDSQQGAVKAALSKITYVSLGSQLGNPFVVGNLSNGRLEPLRVKRWFHLYNSEDDVFTAPVKIWDANNFEQITTHFDIDGFADHAAIEYLAHINTVESVWRLLAEEKLNSRSFGARAILSKTQSNDRPADRRALLIGINEYPDNASRLEGCVNDVFLMSSVLQECGFKPGEIRVCLDDRATAEGIRERLEWLLDDPQPDDERVLYYSGHGATIPEYGEHNEPDRLIETLVPWDFNWTEENAITDEQIFMLYSQLPYKTRFSMILDCCHSGGMHRQGGAKVRGLNPPDDIRHRELQWDQQSGMWVSRGFSRMNAGFSNDEEVNRSYFGQNGATSRLGRSSILRTQDKQEYDNLKRRKNVSNLGPYLPLIIQACQEAEYSYEYRHGVHSYGAFTYSLAKLLRRYKRISFESLVDQTGRQLAELGYQQQPQILGPSALVSSMVPWTEAKMRG